MQTIDINCDMGEGMANDEQLMPFITSANIACGFHAGNEATMKKTVELCLRHNVLIGAHPSFDDKENFGRKEHLLSPEEVFDLVKIQVVLLQRVARSHDTALHHVKPHGSLYNMAAANPTIAKAIAEAVRQVDEDLELYGLSGSHSITEAKKLGLKTRSEVFADRTYQDDGSLTPRSLPKAMIETVPQAMQQVREMIEKQSVPTVNGKIISIVAETICIHGDGPHAVEFAKAIFTSIHPKK